MALRVAYVVSRFPKVSETFIVDEIVALERRGVDVELFSFIRSREAVVQSASKPLAERVRLPRSGAPAVAGGLLHWALRRPLRLCAVISTVFFRHVTAPRTLLRALGAVAHASQFAQAMQRSGVQHVHAHWATYTATCAWAVHRLTGLPYSFTAHADDIFVERPMLARKASDAAFVVTIAEFTRRFLAERVPAAVAERIFVVHCGLDLSLFQARPLPEGERLEIACVARLEPKKGVLHLIDACRVLRDRGIAFRCRVIGEGRERAALDARIAEYDLGGRFEMLGVCPRERVHEVLLASHVSVLPAVVDPEGRADGIPVALIEAQALGRPCVATSVSGIPELIEDERNGLLVPPADVPALADALARLGADRALAARLGAAGSARVRAEFDIDRSAERLNRLMAGAATSEPAPVGSIAAPAPAAGVRTQGGAS